MFLVQMKHIKHAISYIFIHINFKNSLFSCTAVVTESKKVSDTKEPNQTCSRGSNPF